MPSAKDPTTLGAANSGDPLGYNSLIWKPELSRDPHTTGRGTRGEVVRYRAAEAASRRYRADGSRDVANGEYFLLPIVVELLSSPLPGEWREVVVDGEWKFREGSTGQLHDLHPLTDTFIQIVLLERRRKRPRMRYPVCLHSAAERMMQVQQQQHPTHPPTHPPTHTFFPLPSPLSLPSFLQFVTPSGEVYVHDFGSTSGIAPSIPSIVQHAMLGDTDETSFAIVGGKSAATALDTDEKEGQLSSRSNAQPHAPAKANTNHAPLPLLTHVPFPSPSPILFTRRSWGCRQRRRPPPGS